MAKLNNRSRISQSETEKSFSSGSSEEICDALLAVTLNDRDWRWSQTQCLRFLNNVDSDISGLAATCLGHIARIHNKLDTQLVITALKSKLKDPAISGRVQDALDDIEIYLKKKS